MTRFVAGRLDWARPCKRPANMPHARLKGTKADGLRYEKLVAKEFPYANHGQWYEFHDINGHGYCQPDIVFEDEGQIIVIECKLSNYFQAYTQLNSLYKPVLQEVYRLPVRTLVVMRSLRSDTPKKFVCTSLREALQMNGTPVIHWLGKHKGYIGARDRAYAHI